MIAAILRVQQDDLAILAVDLSGLDRWVAMLAEDEGSPQRAETRCDRHRTRDEATRFIGFARDTSGVRSTFHDGNGARGKP